MAMVYAVLKENNIDTSKLTPEECVKKFNELSSKNYLKKEEIRNNRQPKHIELSKQEYAELCSAIRTKFADKIPKTGGILYNNHFYRYYYNKNKEQILCSFKIPIEGNEKLIAKWED